MIIHLAVIHNNLNAIRYLLNTPALFNLDEEGNESKGKNVAQKRGNQPDPYEPSKVVFVEDEKLPNILDL